TVTAHFQDVFTLSYQAGEGGTIAGEANQQVPRGGSGSQVIAVRNSGYVFSQWSDGSTQNPRVDENVMEDISVTAVFRRIFTLRYTAGEGGSLQGNLSQTVFSGEDGTAVTAVPINGFAFVAWSDGRTDNP